MFTPKTLETELIKLLPMTMEHVSDFRTAGNFSKVWQHMPMNRCKDEATTNAWVNEAVEGMAKGNQLAFVTIDKKSNTIIGSTRMIRLDETNKKLEVGHTFITPNFQRTFVNSHAKFLMLQHAFEALDMARVEICTHENNLQSRKAIARIGGHFEGILRKHRRAPNGDYRNTAMFSITNDEWPPVKEKLLSTGKNKQEFYYVSS